LAAISRDEGQEGIMRTFARILRETPEKFRNNDLFKLSVKTINKILLNNSLHFANSWKNMPLKILN